MGLFLVFSLEQPVHLILLFFFTYYLFRAITSRTGTKLQSELGAIPMAIVPPAAAVSMSACGFGADAGLPHGAD